MKHCRRRALAAEAACIGSPHLGRLMALAVLAVALALPRSAPAQERQAPPPPARAAAATATSVPAATPAAAPQPTGRAAALAAEPAVSSAAAAALPRATAADPALRPAASAGPTGATDRTDRADLERTQIIGNRELPKVLYIVPWKRPLSGNMGGRAVNGVIDEALSPIDREVLRRQVSYELQVRAAITGGAAPAPKEP